MNTTKKRERDPLYDPSEWIVEKPPSSRNFKIETTGQTYNFNHNNKNQIVSEF